MGLQVIAILLFSLLGLEGLLIAGVLLNKLRHVRREAKIVRIRELLVDRYFKNSPVPLPGPKILAMQEFLRLSEQIQFSPEEKARAYEDFVRSGLNRKFRRELDGPSVYRRKRAIFFLGHFLNTENRILLVQRLRKEPKQHVRLALANALKNEMDQNSLLAIIESVVGSRRFYQSRIIEIFKSYLQSSHSHFPDIYNRPEIEIKEMFIELGEGVFREDFRKPLLDELAIIEAHLEGNLHPTYFKMRNPRVLRNYHRLLRVLSDVYGMNMEVDKYLKSPDAEVVGIAIRSMAKTKTLGQMEKIIVSADGSPSDDARIEAILRILETNKLFFDELIAMTDRPFSPASMRVIARVLVDRIEFLLLKLQETDEARFSRILSLVVASGSTADLVGFLNRNKNPEIEKKTLKILKPLVQKDPRFLQELNEYLDPELFGRMGFQRTVVPPPERPRSGPEIRKTRWVRRIIIVAFSILPVAFLLFRLPWLIGETPWEIAKEYIILMNEIFVFYFLTVNGFYLFLAVFSAWGADRQSRMWALKSKSMLFQPGMLSSISIIAPAYNEEMSIVESVQSLLNLNYPDYEVIVVNDGSKDHTLEQLINHFKLERKNLPYDDRIKTRPVRGVYKNRDFPNLTVVDKVNGGKADALNVGVNVSKNDYICGIDADSILESESLLRLMSSMLDHDRITLALGGNIFPVNDSVIDHGQLEEKRLPKKLLARLQSIEYLRAFSLGRLGWSVLDSLLIVSGAFGLFEKQILRECGGYLTQSTKDKDTVGEDMELVVRITRQAHETGLYFRVDYIHNALCYTEVPEELPSLLRQRNRWQRGLVDILSYHRKMILNRKYGNAGLLGMGYYFLFELFGPLLEIQGYVAVALGLVFGILNLEIVLLLLMATILLGIVLSLSALLVTERDTVALDFSDTAKLLLLSVFENFGWRQFIAIYRVKGVFSSLKETNAWGTVKRVGFKK